MKKNKRKTNEKEVSKQFQPINMELKNGVFIFNSPLTIREFAIKINKKVNEIITYFLKKGKMFNINYTLNEDQIIELCIEFNLDFKNETKYGTSNFIKEIQIKDKKNDLKARPPIVTIMGHVDHGKTTLIDKIRQSNIIAKEMGGITQHIGAYQIKYNKQTITFLDTPGHLAFTSMRARGAKVTDIVVLVIAVDDGVMPQTIEVIDHIKNANVSVIVFINKMDKLGVDVEKIKGDLFKHNIVSEDWGGDVQFVYGSALNGKGIDKLFEAIILQAEILELKANSNRLAIGTVIESKLDKGKGSITTLIVQNGSLYKKDFIVAGSKYGHIRSMQDADNNEIEVATPSMPVVITGLNYTPNAGDKFFGFQNEKLAKNLANNKAFNDKQMAMKFKSAIKFEDGLKILNIIIKSDVQGTAEAIKNSLSKLENKEVKVNIVRTSIGSISKTDIVLAQASNAIIYTFNISPTNTDKQFAKQSKVEIKNYSIIYKMIEDVQNLIHGMLEPKFKEELIGEAKIIKIIASSKIGNIAGSIVIIGHIEIDSIIRLFRNNKEIHLGKLDGLQIGSNQVKKVETGKEFGCHIKKFNNINLDDIIKVYKSIKVEEIDEK